MYYVSKRLEISFAHRLDLDYESKCSRLHGHNAIVTVYCCSENLDKNGMVADFTKIKDTVYRHLDHALLNETFTFNPTAENCKVDSANRFLTATKSFSRNPRATRQYT